MDSMFFIKFISIIILFVFIGCALSSIYFFIYDITYCNSTFKVFCDLIFIFIFIFLVLFIGNGTFDLFI